MNALRQNKAACAYPAMLLNGVCASSGGVVMALLQERYGLSYQWSGLLLAMLMSNAGGLWDNASREARGRCWPLSHWWAWPRAQR